MECYKFRPYSPRIISEIHGSNVVRAFVSSHSGAILQEVSGLVTPHWPITWALIRSGYTVAQYNLATRNQEVT